MFPRSLDAVLLRALTRWEQLWHAALQRIPPAQQSWLGVAKYSLEFATISRRIIEAGASTTTDRGAGSHRYLWCRPEYDLGVFHEFMLAHGGGGPR